MLSSGERWSANDNHVHWRASAVKSSAGTGSVSIARNTTRVWQVRVPPSRQEPSTRPAQHGREGCERTADHRPRRVVQC